jgi:hypothetical protein
MRLTGKPGFADLKIHIAEAVASLTESEPGVVK